MKTHIDALDEMLGLNRVLNNLEVSASIPRHLVLLLRGAPGSGKTTLGIQILANHLKAQSENNPGSTNMGLFFTLEVGQQTFRNQSFEARIGKDLANVIKASAEAPSQNSGDKYPTLFFFERDDLANELPFTNNAERMKEAVDRFLEDSIKARIPYEFKINKKERNGIILVDSINVLADLVRGKMQKPDQIFDLRMLLHQFSQTLLKYFHRATVILIGEHHAQGGLEESLVAESFGCDIEILLTTEPIAGHANLSPDAAAPLGYSIERRLHGHYSPSGGPPGSLVLDEPQRVESRSFCRILKSRYSPNQSRRCAYDIVPGRGVVFSETLAGDGGILLVFENKKQEEFWQEFIRRDVPLQFPALRYALFDRPGVQRIFATARRMQQFPQKTDLLLVSFDTYWVNWYWQLCQRTALHESINHAFDQGLDKLRRLEPLPVSAHKGNPGDYRIDFDDEKTRELWANAIAQVDLKFTDAQQETTRRLNYAMDIPRHAKLSASPPDFKELSGEVIKILRSQPFNDSPLAELLKEVGRPGDDFAAHLEANLVDVWRKLAKKEFGVLHLIPRNKLRLFGEARSTFIPELKMSPHDALSDDIATSPVAEGNATYVPFNRRRYIPTHWPTCLELASDYYVSIPYNANVSFLVYRKDLLEAVTQEIKRKGNIDVLGNSFKAFCGAQIDALDQFRKQRNCEMPEHCASLRGKVDGWWREIECNLAKDSPSPPKSWEELVVFCSAVKGRHFIIDTDSYDTFLCTFLEFYWGTGLKFSIGPDYATEGNAEEMLDAIFLAFYLLKHLFGQGIIERQSSLDPGKFGVRFNDERVKEGADNFPEQPIKSDEWLFARHWYSTLVNSLTAKLPLLEQYCWDPKFGAKDQQAILGIAPLPGCLVGAAFSGKPLPKVASWGEWHFAVLNGSENETLAVDLINNFMSSQNVYERAMSCAALPTVQEFYERYSDSPCFNLPERDNIILPGTTFGEMKETIFKNARTRGNIFDFRHCLRELHPILLRVQNFPQIGVPELGEMVIKSVRRIRDHRNHLMLIH